MPRIVRKSFCFILLLVCADHTYAWGDKGHRIIALIAWHYLTPATQAKIDNILRHDRSGLTATDFASETTWADAYRDSDRNTTRIHYEQTRRWHYINLEITHPDFVSACFGSPPLRPSQRASEGPAQSCSVDKIEQFVDELSAANTTDAERLLALQFTLHLVGDLHQPLHASDNDGEGGNALSVSAKNFDGSLHAFWDNAVIEKGASETIACKLIARIDAAQVQRWRGGSPREWAQESFSIARTQIYDVLPAPDESGHYTLAANDVDHAKSIANEQLVKAGLRLAWLLERELNNFHQVN